MATKSTSARKTPAAKQAAAAKTSAGKLPPKKIAAPAARTRVAAKSATPSAAKPSAAKTAATAKPAPKKRPATKATATANKRIDAMKKQEAIMAEIAPEKKAVASTKGKPKKSKMVRDSFTMPELEYQALGDVKKACLKAGLAVKKSELLRVGVAIIKDMDVERLRIALATLAPLKAGRPKLAK